MTPNRAAGLTVVSPRSLEAWYRQFSGRASEVLFVGEGTAEPGALADLVEAHTRGGRVRILSGHDSLLRDWVLANELRSRGLLVDAQTGMAASAALDKVLQKQLLDLASIPVPTWGRPDSPPPDRRILWKGRASTQSRQIAWHSPSKPIPGDSYWECYVDGVEYSVVLHRVDGRTLCFPPVWKGHVREDLSPPWRRLRLVPSGAPAGLVEEMAVLAARVAELFDVWGFAEVEFIVTDDAEPLVTDINPRINGTMRIVAMATETAIFDPAQLARSQVSTTRWAAEIPYEGRQFAAGDVVATSRLTCAGGTRDDVFDTLARYGVETAKLELPGEWRAD